MREEWRSVSGYEGLYEVSNLGRVRSLGRLSRGRNSSTRRIAPRILKAGTNPTSGYHAVSLWRDSRQKTVSVHKLVTRAFMGEKPDGKEIRHLRGVAAGDGISNLAYGTPAENAADKRAHGTQPLGECVHSAKLTTRRVQAIRKLKGTRTPLVAAQFGVAARTIRDIWNGVTWKHLDA